MKSITAAIAALTVNLQPGSWHVSFYFGCAVLMVRTTTPEGRQKVLDEKGEHIGFRWGLPDGHTGWDCTVISPDGETIGTHVNNGEAIATCQKYVTAHPENTEPAADVATGSPAPIPDASAAAPDILDTPIAEVIGNVTVENMPQPEGNRR